MIELEINTLAGTKLKESIFVPPNIKVLSDGDSIDKHHHVFRILSQEKGDERLVWDSRSLDDINSAKTMFNSLIKKGLKPFRVGLNGKATSEAMPEFDPKAEEIIFLPFSFVTGG